MRLNKQKDTEWATNRQWSRICTWTTAKMHLFATIALARLAICKLHATWTMYEWRVRSISYSEKVTHETKGIYDTTAITHHIISWGRTKTGAFSELQCFRTRHTKTTEGKKREEKNNTKQCKEHFSRTIGGNFIHPKKSTVSTRAVICRRKCEPIRFNIVHATTFGGTG